MRSTYEFVEGVLVHGLTRHESRAKKVPGEDVVTHAPVDHHGLIKATRCPQKVTGRFSVQHVAARVVTLLSSNSSQLRKFVPCWTKKVFVLLYGVFNALPYKLQCLPPNADPAPTAL